MPIRAFTFSLLWMTFMGCSPEQPAPTSTPDQISGSAVAATALAEGDTDPSTYVGSGTCANCHAAEHDAWRGSHHDLALQVAGTESVLAPFDGSHRDVSFHQQDGAWSIVPGPDAQPLPVRYTFGVAPLQQYVVETSAGRLQTFPVPWDSRPAESGGARWFDLHPGENPPGDPMHWSGRANSWNAQCADCHSTAVRKHYDPANRSYATRFEVEDVGCEACHGPGSRHSAAPADFPLASLDAQAGQINACAPCHSRRSQLIEGFRPATEYLDYYAPALLRGDLYHVDGQIRDEVYEYGSFLQSPMHRAGVTCSDCHDPHRATLKLPGNALCTQCHSPAGREEFQTLTKKTYDAASHHFHPADSAGAQCVNCHMPTVTYMGVDERRDHSFRRPRPDLAARLEVPDVCSGCHQNRDATWAASVVAEHFGPERPAHFADTFAAANRSESAAGAELAALVADTAQPIMVRATALSLLGAYSRGYVIDAITLARNSEPLLRYAAPFAASSLSPETRWRLLSPLLADELRAIRDQAFTALLPIAGADPAYRARLQNYLPMYLADHAGNRDFPETLTNIASAHTALGDPVAAEAALTEALEIQPSWVPGLLNLADLYRATGRDALAGRSLEQALEIAPEMPEPTFGYGLWLARQGRAADSVDYLARAAELAPDVPNYGYVLALAVNGAGEARRATDILQALLLRFPENEDLLIAAATMLRDQQRFTEALAAVDRLLELRPSDAQLRRFREELAAAR